MEMILTWLSILFRSHSFTDELPYRLSTPTPPSKRGQLEIGIRRDAHSKRISAVNQQCTASMRDRETSL
jgi:hypothetical protein